MGTSRYDCIDITLRGRIFLFNEDLTKKKLATYGIKTNTKTIKENKERCIYKKIITGGMCHIKVAKLYSIELCKKYMSIAN